MTNFKLLADPLDFLSQVYFKMFHLHAFLHNVLPCKIAQQDAKIFSCLSMIPLFQQPILFLIIYAQYRYNVQIQSANQP